MVYQFKVKVGKIENQALENKQTTERSKYHWPLDPFSLLKNAWKKGHAVGIYAVHTPVLEREACVVDKCFGLLQIYCGNKAIQAI